MSQNITFSNLCSVSELYGISRIRDISAPSPEYNLIHTENSTIQ